MNPAVRISDAVMQQAIEVHASDVHFYPYPQETRIYFRIHGERHLHRIISSSDYQLLLTYYKFTSGMDIGEIRRPQNGVITHYLDHNEYSFRLSTLPVHDMESLAIRILPRHEVDSLDSLFLFPYQCARLKQWSTRLRGIILFTGSTGSGKTTTLYALMQELLDKQSLQTITLEDPVEKKVDRMLQVEINEKAGLSYAAGLKAALRHDPDILMVGEIRDAKTAQFTFEASLTGHLVLSTIHANNAPGTIHRLMDLGVQETYIRQSLIAVAALELVAIRQKNGARDRAAIAELLDGEAIQAILKGGDPRYQTFDHLRKKAYAYGFVANQQAPFEEKAE